VIFLSEILKVYGREKVYMNYKKKLLPHGNGMNQLSKKQMN